MTRERNLYACLVVLCLTTSAACSPSVNDFTIADGEPGERLAASARVRPNQTSLQSVTVATSVAGSDAFGAEQPMTENASTYSGETLAHLPGDYDARITVRYIPGFQSTVRSVTRTASFTLGWPDGTFAFENSAAAVDGWEFDGIYLEDDSVNVARCDPLSPEVYTWATSGWPLVDFNQNPPIGSGSLRIRIGRNCFPQSDAAGVPQWQFNLRSPDLRNRPEWQGISGVSFRAIVTQIGLKAQATVVYEGDDGRDAFASPSIGGTNDFADIGSQWSIVTRSGYVPEGRTIRRVLIRVYGLQGDLTFTEAGPANMLVDVIQPVR